MAFGDVYTYSNEPGWWNIPIQVTLHIQEMEKLKAENAELRQRLAEAALEGCGKAGETVKRLEAEISKFQTWYYKAEETLCSCHLPDNLICEWHEQNPGAPDAEVFTLADRAETAEAERDRLREQLAEKERIIAMAARDTEAWRIRLGDWELERIRLKAVLEGYEYLAAALRRPPEEVADDK